jgi:hypothetical protein
VTRFLVVLAWFKEHGNIGVVTVDHVYTCYRVMKWPLDIPDFAQPLRHLKSKQLIDGHPDGGYVINHLGLQRVNELSEA